MSNLTASSLSSKYSRFDDDDERSNNQSRRRSRSRSPRKPAFDLVDDKPDDKYKDAVFSDGQRTVITAVQAKQSEN